MIHILVNLRFWSFESLLESEALERGQRNGETVVSLMRAYGFGEGTILVFIDAVKCTVFHACLTY